MLQWSVVSNITMNGRLKPCRAWRSAFLSIKLFFTILLSGARELPARV
jgi:hypothetical protein